MLRKRHGLWIIDEDRKTADQPHWITIVIGMLSPALAIVALAVSLLSLKTSDLSLRIANRAYVGVVSGNLHFADFGYAVQDKGPDAGTHCIVRMDIFAAIQNAGNSPAVIGGFTPNYRLPKGWSTAPAWIKTKLNNSVIGVVAPKSTINWSYTELFELTPETYYAFRNFPGQAFVYMDASANYKDVFQETTTLKWCWVAAGNERRTTVADCARNRQIVLATPLP